METLNLDELKKHFTYDEINHIKENVKNEEHVKFVNNTLALPNALSHGTDFLCDYITDTLAWWEGMDWDKFHPLNSQSEHEADFEESWELDPRNEG